MPTSIPRVLGAALLIAMPALTDAGQNTPLMSHEPGT